MNIIAIGVSFSDQISAYSLACELDGQRVKKDRLLPAEHGGQVALFALMDALELSAGKADVTISLAQEYIVDGVNRRLRQWQENGFRKIADADLWAKVAVALEGRRVTLVSHKALGNSLPTHAVAMAKAARLKALEPAIPAPVLIEATEDSARSQPPSGVPVSPPMAAPMPEDALPW